jgi:4-hydroxybenzoate polyprenyltransferase
MGYPQSGVGSPPGSFGKIRVFLDMIKFEHTVFALPFAYLTLFLAESGWPSRHAFIWITVAMVAGRTFGMAANRLIDAGIDARNPRTRTRAIPSGSISHLEVVIFMAAAVAVFLVSVYRLSPLCHRLWPIVLVVMVCYPYAKRFTWLSHLALGLVYVMIPTGVWIALRNELALEPVVLGLGAGLWVAGFDIIYAIQDVEVDHREGLHSMPADLGVAAALRVARLFHLAFVVALLLAGVLLQVGLLYYIGVLLTAGLLAYEHRLVKPDDCSHINIAFFTTNGIISIVLFILIASDTLVRLSI